MNVIYTDKAKQLADEFLLLQQATAFLEKKAGPSQADVTVSWDRTDDGHRRRYVLRLADWSGEVSEQYSPSNLRSHDLRWSLIHLWGDLLQIRSHKLFDK